jgi:nucleotidyltransferase substrate binding protein (TIGR01987 family)
MLDLSSLEKALGTLEEATLAFDEAPNDLFIRDACIQRFEYSYELAHKMLRRYLALTEPNPADIDAMSFPDMIRLGFARGLLAEEWAAWRRYREARNKTSHAYDRSKAEEVVKMIPGFLASALRMLQELKRRQASAS